MSEKETKPKCLKCSQELSNRHHAVECSECKGWTCIGCLRQAEPEVWKVGLYDQLAGKEFVWSCVDCTKPYQFSSKIAISKVLSDEELDALEIEPWTGVFPKKVDDKEADIMRTRNVDDSEDRETGGQYTEGMEQKVWEEDRILRDS